MHFVFETLSYNELDHHTPVAAKLLTLGHSVTFVLGTDERLVGNPRVKYLAEWPMFRTVELDALVSRRSMRVHKLLMRSTFGRAARVFPSDRQQLRALVGLSAFFRLFRKAPLPEFDVAISGWGDVTSFLMCLAQSRRVPIVALPHGYPCIKNDDYNPHIRKILSETGSPPDFSLRNYFHTYVVATERNRQMLLRWNMKPERVEIWGNARFAPEWVQTLHKILPNQERTNAPHLQQVLLLLPASTSAFQITEIHSLISRLSELDIDLMIKPHTRETSDVGSQVPDRVMGRSNVFVYPNVDTTKLIERADTILNFATGTAIEALLFGKRFIFCKYLTTNQLSWEDCNGIKVAGSESDVIKHVTDRTWTIDVDLVDPYLQVEIFAGGRVPDPPLHYATQLIRIAEGNAASRAVA